MILYTLPRSFHFAYLFATGAAASALRAGRFRRNFIRIRVSKVRYSYTVILDLIPPSGARVNRAQLASHAHLEARDRTSGPPRLPECASGVSSRKNYPGASRGRLRRGSRERLPFFRPATNPFSLHRNSCIFTETLPRKPRAPLPACSALVENKLLEFRDPLLRLVSTRPSPPALFPAHSCCIAGALKTHK